ncbi:Penicillin-insensitive murein endopeptidase [Rhodovastum atsumiense]|uniref:Penicillin-insensitive murein endopeptidase n=1 Tax=Rhodovastum atsumiense TaxID=504468 RepID=A0A5M6ITW5_9PROT|nr:penicillin-insensitive murein endopeptidase [Rhodovastum atsumiense]KAA5611702.1 penicillin-insensitive murein endopeptidase [Rhodovastum atsumiense]CAH2604278.1 Penicillin-insensitive murein endopeptidase [Rhodovastum atsumiense]
MCRLVFALVPLVLLALSVPGHAQTGAAGGIGPAPGPVRVIGGQGAGCIAGAVALPDTAPGMQTIRASRSSFWGHPDMIATLLRLGRLAQAAGLPDIYMGDISGPRGGPLRGGHVSHQMGIDADIWLDVDPPHPLRLVAEREAIDPPSLVRPDGRAVDPARWRPGHVTLLRLAAGLPRVDRILVNPAIKLQLCREVTGDRSWLRLIRPWWGHASHMHLRLRCPEGQPLCVQAPPPPPGDGCDATLDWWFAQLDLPPKPPGPPRRPPPLPAACQAILGAP